MSEDFAELPIAGYEEMLREVAAAYPNLKLVASTLRTAHTASRNAWGAIALYEDKIVHVPQREIDIFDRVGGGDSFASGLIYGLLAGKGIEWAVRCGVAHGALAMTTPGDTSMATLAEVERVMKGGVGAHRALTRSNCMQKRTTMPETTQEIIERVGLIPVLRAKSVAQGRAVVEAMIAGGVTVVEVTMTVPGAIDLFKELKKEYGAKLLLGSGTVTTADQAEATIEAGAEFVVSPSLHPEVIAATKANEKISCPGALTPTEAITGMECRRGLREDLSLLGSGRRELSEVAAGAVSASQAHPHRRRHAANRRRALSRPARARWAWAATS